MGDIQDAWSQESEEAWQKSLRDRGITPPKKTDPTTFTGKIGVVVNIVYDYGDRFTKMSEITLPGIYVGDLTAIPFKDQEWYEKGDFFLAEIPKGYYAPSANEYGQCNKLFNEKAETQLKAYVLKEIFNTSHKKTFFTRDTSDIVKSPYFEFGGLNKYDNFYVYPNSPADKWIEGNNQPPYDHTAPKEFGVSYTVVRRRKKDVFLGGNPLVEFKCQVFQPGGTRYVDTLTTDTVRFGGNLSINDFDIRSKTQFEKIPKYPRGYGIPGKMEKDLYFYKGARVKAFEDFVVARIDSHYKYAYNVEIAGQDAEFFVYPNSLMESWIESSQRDTTFAPNMALSIRLEITPREKEQQEKKQKEKEEDKTKLQKEYVFDEDGYNGEGSGEPYNLSAEEITTKKINDEIDELIKNYRQNLDNARPPYEIKDLDGDGDFNEASDLFGTKQDDVKDMQQQTSLDFQESARPDYYRPFDEYDNENNQVVREIEDSTVVTKKELLEFNEYAQEAYMTDREFKMKTTGLQYQDNRKNSWIHKVGNAEVRIYEYYDEEKKEERLIVAFRGTQNPVAARSFTDAMEGIRDIITDITTKCHNLEYIGIKTDNIDAKGIVHQGFADYVNKLYPNLLSLIMHRKGAYLPRGGKIYVVGHSLGAGAAIIFSYMLFMRENITPDRIYLFGAPMGIWTFGDHINKNLPIINVFHTHDVIPYVSTLFKHHGIKLVFTLDGSLAAYPVNMDVPNYDLQNLRGTRLLLGLIKNNAYKDGTTPEEHIRALEKVGVNMQDDATVLKEEYHKNVKKYGVSEGLIENFFNNIKSGLYNVFEPCQLKALALMKKRYSEAGEIFYHTRYKQTIDEWTSKSIKIDKFRYFDKLFKHDPNPRGHFVKHDYDYLATVDSYDYYYDKNGDIYIGTEDVNGLYFNKLDSVKPLGLILYDKKTNNLDNKTIVFYS